MGLFANFMRNTGREPVTSEVIGIPLTTLYADVAEYVGKLETEESARWCKCTWQIHPDDVGIKMGHCRDCGLTPKAHNTEVLHAFRGVRKRMVDGSSVCPVHTKEGLIIGFIEWVKNERS